MNGKVYTREELTKWLLTFVHKNSVLGKQCERLIKRLDDIEIFVADMRKERVAICDRNKCYENEINDISCEECECCTNMRGGE